MISLYMVLELKLYQKIDDIIISGLGVCLEIMPVSSSRACTIHFCILFFIDRIPLHSQQSKGNVS